MENDKYKYQLTRWCNRRDELDSHALQLVYGGADWIYKRNKSGRVAIFTEGRGIPQEEFVGKGD